jgi:hypothetical protein
MWKYGNVVIPIPEFQILKFSIFRHELTYNQAGKGRNT